MLKLDRRTLLGAAAALASSSLLTANAQQAAETVSVEDLAAAGPLGDKILGSATAPVTIYEYASLTCPHCAAFHADGFKFLKEKYIDTGKVKYVLRDFPLDPLAAAGFMLAHCAGEGKYYPMVDLIFAQQRSLMQTDKPVDALLALSRQAGFTQESFQACLKNQSIYDGVNAVRQRGTEKFNVDSTPTFFINGRRYKGSLSPQELERILEPLLKV
ncbi:MAG: DsbA family protein [Methylocystis sp.]|jgi:protein-disulfide isomerase|nr:DsbA family protein [Methylocystis sp.]MCA3589807.1 DsbA family protein [Methylocystis sp.]MCA3591594.1 DsbA family protein [Methylocystis sp.]